MHLDTRFHQSKVKTLASKLDVGTSFPANHDIFHPLGSHDLGLEEPPPHNPLARVLKLLLDSLLKQSTESSKHKGLVA